MAFDYTTPHLVVYCDEPSTRICLVNGIGHCHECVFDLWGGRNGRTTETFQELDSLLAHAEKHVLCGHIPASVADHIRRDVASCIDYLCLEKFIQDHV